MHALDRKILAGPPNFAHDPQCGVSDRILRGDDIALGHLVQQHDPQIVRSPSDRKIIRNWQTLLKDRHCVFRSQTQVCPPDPAGSGSSSRRAGNSSSSNTVVTTIFLSTNPIVSRSGFAAG